MTNTFSGGTGGVSGQSSYQTGTSSQNNAQPHAFSVLGQNAGQSAPAKDDPRTETSNQKKWLENAIAQATGTSEESSIRMDEKRAIARKLLDKGVAIDTIAFATGLSSIEIKLLRPNLLS